MSSKKKNPGPTQTSKIRIIGGRWRGRKLSVLDEDGLRPTGDRMRETLFNWLAPYMPGARCLDAFAGTGALGLEALSRGAKFTHFIELKKNTAEYLKQNIDLLEGSAEVTVTDFIHWKPIDMQPFDIIFLDPPFNADLWEKSVDHVENALPVSDQALIYVEMPREKALSIPQNWRMYKQKSAGQVIATLYETSPPNPS